MEKRLTVRKKNKNKVLFEHEMPSDSIVTVGNNPTATLELRDKGIAPEQFIIVSEQNDILLMNRADGTKINGEDLGLGGQVSLQIGDQIEIGEYQVTFEGKNGLNGSVNNETEKEKEEIISSKVEIKTNESVEETQDELEVEEKKEKDFSEILDNLKNEDSFYFQIVDVENIVEKIGFEDEEIWIGVKFDECTVKKNKNDLDEVYAQVKKDWSGAVIYPNTSEELFLDDEVLLEPTRLKNNSKIVLVDSFEEEKYASSITFHEPNALQALNSILPEELPEPVSHLIDEKNEQQTLELTENNNLSSVEDSVADKKKSESKKGFRLFGYFSPLEILIMTIGTIVTAILIFLILEYV